MLPHSTPPSVLSMPRPAAVLVPEPATTNPLLSQDGAIRLDAASMPGGGTSMTINASSNNDPSKVDKPRPHQCTTCSKAFHRLEHLKRHERSHTKEKPFQCPECARCFARRDLLLRHQQKLHLTNNTSARPRSNRRDSTASVTITSRARRGSTAGTQSAMRPRANTIGHVDGATLGLFQASNPTSIRRFPAGSQNLAGAANVGTFQYKGMSTAPGSHGDTQGLPKLETQGLLGFSTTNTLRTAPPYGGSHLHDKDIGDMFGGPASTINPAQLHFSESPMSGFSAGGLFDASFPTDSSGLMEDDDAFDWTSRLPTQSSVSLTDDYAVEASSPSAISTASQSGISEIMMDMSTSLPTTSAAWQANTTILPSHPHIPLDLPDAGFIPLAASPQTVRSQMSALPNLSPGSFATSNHNDPFRPLMEFPPSTPTPLMTNSTLDSITDLTREAMLSVLSQPSPFNHRKYSAPSISPTLETQRERASSSSLPNTQDLKRYVNAYLQFFQPHLPFLHVPTLSFESLAFMTSAEPIAHAATLPSSAASSGEGSLVLAIAAIGALYESEPEVAKELSNASKKIMQLFLERRKAELLMSGNTTGSENAQNTPLWIVQAMLLNVIYGHNCGDKMSSDIASTHCIALVNLARTAELRHPPHSNWRQSSEFGPSVGQDPMYIGDGLGQSSWIEQMKSEIPEEQMRWVSWKANEERIRTLYAVFIISSLLVSTYNHAPALSNSEILVDLPCEEDLWVAPDALTWQAKVAEHSIHNPPLKFSDALAYLLSASKRENGAQVFSNGQLFGMQPSLPTLPGIRVSTFGCLVLINALHNYIWETRQRHHSPHWTGQETESMHAHIEPALRAWKMTWTNNPGHSLERLDTYGIGPLSADSIPLLDLAYVRLYVNFGRSKEAFWQEDFSTAADELASGSDPVQPSELSSSGSSDSTNNDSIRSSTGSNSSPITNDSSPDIDMDAVKTPTPSHSIPNLQLDPLHSFDTVTNKERHLRRAAFYALSTLSVSSRIGTSATINTSKELPLQSAICQFDCAQVLAEWVTTLQERVGQALGILGKDEIEYSQIPASMLLEDEDCKLLQKIKEMLDDIDVRMRLATTSSSNLPSSRESSFGNKILGVTAYMLDQSTVWPVAHLMASSLERQAEYMDERAKKSTRAHQ